MFRSRLWIAALAPALSGAAAPQMPPFRATAVTGQLINLDRSRHEIVLIHYWATWCAPCRVEMPMLDAISRRYGNQGLRVIGIALDAGASRQKIATAAAAVSFPVARLGDSNIRVRDVPAALPETLVYGRDGSLRYRFRASGTMLDAATLDRIIPPLVAER